MFRTRVCLSTGIVMSLFVAIGCRSAPPRNALQQSQLRAQQLYQQNKMLAMERNGMGSTAAQLAADKAALEQQYLAAKQNLDAANARLGNLASTNSQLEDRMRTLLVGNKPGNNPMSDDTNRRLEEMRKKYKDFDFDPQTGVSKFSNDLLFSSGSDEVQPRAKQILDEFAQIMNQGDSRSLKVLVSGHTDDKPVSRKSTADKHHDNIRHQRKPNGYLGLRPPSTGGTEFHGTDSPEESPGRDLCPRTRHTCCQCLGPKYAVDIETQRSPLLTEVGAALIWNRPPDSVWKNDCRPDPDQRDPDLSVFMGYRSIRGLREVASGRVLR